MASFKVALIQLSPKSLDTEHNFAVAATHIRTAAIRGAQLAVLPEYHLSGWAPDDSQFLSIALSGEAYVRRYQALAEELKISIVPGTILVAKEGIDENLIILNKAYFIGPNGSILGQYTKTNLWHPERKHLTSGPAVQKQSSEQCLGLPHSAFDTPIGRVGLLICYDLAFPEAFRALVRAGARIVIIPTFTKADDMSPLARAYNPDGETLFLRSALISRAFENTCCIIFCNAGGDPKSGYVGLSQVTLPIIGTLPGSFSDSNPGITVVDVDMTVVDIAEDNYKIRQDLARTDFHY